MDAELAVLARGEGRTKLRLGELLDALFLREGHHELGFSSIDAYVIERVRQSAAWGRQARGVARRLREKQLDRVRGATVSGDLSWSKTELLCRHATSEGEVALLNEAMGSTVRALKTRLEGADSEREEASHARVSKVVPVNATEVAMLMASRTMVSYLVGRQVGDEAFVEALLAEAETSLQRLGHEDRRGLIHAVDLDALEEALGAIASTHARTARPEAPAPAPAERRFEPLSAAPAPGTLRGIDDEIVQLSQALARRNLELGHLLKDFRAARAWARLGYASLAAYARERLGLSLSSVEHRMTLARAAARHPVLGEALCAGDIGYEAGLLVAQVLGRSGSEALALCWVERARRRTIKHLREEVRAVLQAAQLRPGVSRRPPDDEDLEAVRSLEEKILDGEPLRGFLGSAGPGPQESITLAVPSELGPASHALRFRISRDLALYAGRVEAEFRRWAPPTASFVGFLCTNFWQTWLPCLEAFDSRWKRVFRRDLHACRSPVCERRDVTPHHLVFRAHGGSDDASNMVSLCSWCHLEGVHEGRLTATGTANHMTWRLGRDPWLEVRGRDRTV